MAIRGLRDVLLSAAALPAVAFYGLSPGATTRFEATKPTESATLWSEPATKPTESTTKPPAFPPLKINKAFGIENEYQLNLGRAIDTLRRDYPQLLQSAPDFSIFTEGVTLRTADSKRRIEGMEAYSRLFDVLRFMRNTTMVRDEVGARIVVCDGTIRVRWNAKLTMHDAFSALPGLTNRDEAGRPVVFVDGVSVYYVNGSGLVYRHVLEDVVVTPRSLQGAVDLALVAWPGGFSPPVAVGMPHFQPATSVPMQAASARSATWAVSGRGSLGQTSRTAEARATSDEHTRVAASRLGTAGSGTHVGKVGSGTHGRRLAEPRAPAPVASAGETPIDRAGAETPMERAARERAEDAQAAQRLRELRAPTSDIGGQKGGPFSRLVCTRGSTAAARTRWR
jgi:hypothetical protein